MSGADIYARVLEETGDQQKAAEAAAHTVKLNTVINTLLNVTSVSPLFKTMGSMKHVSQLGLQRLPGEARGTWLKRLNQLEIDGVPQASLRKALLLEAGQEGLEEEVNLFAEGEGLVKGGLKEDKGLPLSRFFESMFSEEGALAGILGAVGGTAQTAGMSLIPYRNYTDENGQKSWVNNKTLAEMQDNKAASQIIHTFKQDIESLTKRQQALNTALASKDEAAITKAREQLFDVAALKSIREGVGDEFIEDIDQISKTDNIRIGEDGLTDAMRMGYANDPNDNAYKNIASTKISDIKELTKEYETVRRLFPNKFVADEVFRQGMEVHGFRNFVEELHKANTEISEQLLKNTRSFNILIDENDSLVADLISRTANVSALQQAAQSLKDSKAEGRLTNNITNSFTVEDHVLREQLSTLTPQVRKRLEENKGIISQLVLSRAPLFVANEELKIIESDYAKLLENPNETERSIIQQAQEAVNKAKSKVEKQEKAKKIKEEKAQEKADKEAVKPVKTTKAKVIGDYTIAPNKEGGFDVVDNKTGDIIEKTSDEKTAIKLAKDNSAPKEITSTTPKVIKPVISAEPKPAEPDTSYQGKTKAEEDEERRDIDTTLEKASTKRSSASNKIAYRARENDDTEDVKDEYRLIHSKTITEETPVILRVAKDNQAYKEGMEAKDIPIGIYTKKNELLGYVPVLRKDDPLLYDIRKHVVDKGEVETTLSDKAPGRLNWSKTVRTTSEALPTLTSIVIGRDGKFWSGPKKAYTSKTRVWNNIEKIKDGYTYAVVDTPDGNEFAIPLDVKPVSTEVVNSVMTAFRIFMLKTQNMPLDPRDEQLVKDIFKEYGLDLRTAEGMGKYFKFFFYNYDLGDSERVLENNEDRNDKRWVQWDFNGIRFMQSGGAVEYKGKLQAKKIGADTIIKRKDGKIDPDATERLQEGLMEELKKHLEGMYFNIDLEQLQEKKKIKLPLLLYNEKAQALDVKPLNYKNYSEYVKNITQTKAVGFKVGPKEYSYFVSPQTYFSTVFLGQEEEQKYGKPLEKPVENATLNVDPEIPSMTRRLGKIRFTSNHGPVDPDTLREALNYCA
jgi:hypothetical protein